MPKTLDIAERHFYLHVMPRGARCRASKVANARPTRAFWLPHGKGRERVGTYHQGP